MSEKLGCDVQHGEWASGNIFIRPVTLAKAGDVMDGHEHEFDHTTIVFTGRVHIHATCKEGCDKEGEFSAPSHALIRKDWRHTITALEDNTVFWCVYSHTTPQGEISQVYDGWAPAYAAKAA